jgi:nondiscriminating glutamyl-tRNA synthetase
MTVRVRFAPSPTGYLHIGGARTAIYNYLFAKANNGKFIVRVEDTDEERSTKQFENSQMADLQWLGLDYDEGPGKDGGFGPYRQSERLDLYMKYALQLVDEGKAFYDFCSDEELEAMKEAAKEGAPAYTGKWREEAHWQEAKQRVADGEKAPIRFKVEDRDFGFTDIVRGEVKFPAGMVGDFVIMRSNGKPTYNFCNVVDDMLMEISHVIRGEDHVNNTVRQLMIYEALGATLPIFAHVSLLIGEDRQKLSKRHGATSVDMYRSDSYLAETMTNYLCLLGWSHPEEKTVFKLDDILNHFDLRRCSKSPAIYDIEKLKWINGKHIDEKETINILDEASEFIPEGHSFHSQDEEWKKTVIELLKEKVQLYSELAPMIDEYIFAGTVEDSEKLRDILSWETTPQIAEYVSEQLNSMSDEFITAETFGEWMNYCKKELKIKGKPLFMGFRGVLTGQDHGPDLKVLVPLISVENLKSRLGQVLNFIKG